MTENKRFINDIDNGQLIDTKRELSTIDYSDTVDFYELWEFLNKLADENEQLKQINSNLSDFRGFITEQNAFNEKQRKELQLQMLRLYNYFENYFEDTMSPNAFSEMWDNVKKDEKWEKRGARE